MKTLIAVIERNEDAWFAYLKNWDGCVAGGDDYEEVKTNLENMIEMFLKEDRDFKKWVGNAYRIKFEVDLESVFDLIPEVNISQLAKAARLNSGLLRQYVSGSKKASETQAGRVMEAIKNLSVKLNSISLTTH